MASTENPLKTNSDPSQIEAILPAKPLYTLEKLTSLQQGSKCFTHCRAQVASGKRGDIFLADVANSLVNISCLVCKRVFKNYMDWDNHADQMLREEDPEHKDVFKIQKVISKEAAGSYDKILGEFSCEMCKKSFSQVGELQDHISNNFSYIQLICSQCGGQFCNIDSHLSQHNKEQYCGECGQSFEQFKMHIKDFHRGFLSVLVLNTTSCGGSKGIRFLKQIMLKTGIRFMPEEIKPAEIQPKPQLVRKTSNINDFFSSFDPFSGQERVSLGSPAIVGGERRLDMPVSSTPKSVIIPTKTNSQKSFSNNSSKNLFASPLSHARDAAVPWDHAIRPMQSPSPLFKDPINSSIAKNQTKQWDQNLRPTSVSNEQEQVNKITQSLDKDIKKIKENKNIELDTKVVGESDKSDTSIHKNLKEVFEAVGNKGDSDIANKSPMKKVDVLESKTTSTEVKKMLSVNNLADTKTNEVKTEPIVTNVKRVEKKTIQPVINETNIKVEPTEDIPAKTITNIEAPFVKNNIKLENNEQNPIITPIKTVNTQQIDDIRKTDVSNTQIDDSLLKQTETKVKTELEPVENVTQLVSPKTKTIEAKNKINVQSDIKKESIKTLTAAKLNKIKDPTLLKQVKSMIMELKTKLESNDKNIPIVSEKAVTKESINAEKSLKTENTNANNSEDDLMSKPPNQLPGNSFDESGKRIWAFKFPSSSCNYLCEICGFQSKEGNSIPKFEHMINWHFKERSKVEKLADHSTVDKMTQNVLEELQIEGSSLKDATMKDILEKHQVENSLHNKDGNLIEYKLVPNPYHTNPLNSFHGPSNMCELCGFKTDSKLKMGEQNKVKIDHMVLYHFQLRVDAVLPKEPPFNCPGEIEMEKFSQQTYQQCWNISKKGKKTREDLVRHYLGTHGMLYKWTKDFTEDVKKGVESLEEVMEKHQVEHALPKEMHSRKFKLVLETEILKQKGNQSEILEQKENLSVTPNHFQTKVKRGLKLVNPENLIIKNNLSNPPTENINNENEAITKKSLDEFPPKPTQIKINDVIDTDKKSWRFKCNFCIRKFVSQLAVDSHEKISHRILSRNQLKQSKSNDVSTTIKPELKSGFGDLKRSPYKYHREPSSKQSPSHLNRVVCNICQKSCCNKYYLKQHKQLKHGIDSNDESISEISETSMNLSETSMNNSESSETSLNNSKNSMNNSETSMNNSKTSMNNSETSMNNSETSMNNSEMSDTSKDDGDINLSKRKLDVDNIKVEDDDKKEILDERLTKIKRMRLCRVELCSAGFGGIYM